MNAATRKVIEERIAEALIPVFVYGTLRIGQYNYRWARAAVRETVKNCRTNGKLYFSRGLSGSYPVAKFDEEGTILGDVLWCDPSHPDYGGMVRMELGAGYEVREIEVVTAKSETMEALGFHYLHRTRGDAIPNGDWVKAVSG